MALRPCSGVMDRDLMVKGAMVCMANIMGTDVVNKKQGLFARASINGRGSALIFLLPS